MMGGVLYTEEKKDQKECSEEERDKERKVGRSWEGTPYIWKSNIWDIPWPILRIKSNVKVNFMMSTQ